MTTVHVYHNPNFLHYRGDHTQIAPPVAPVAAITVAGDLPETTALSRAFARTQHVGGRCAGHRRRLLRGRATGF